MNIGQCAIRNIVSSLLVFSILLFAHGVRSEQVPSHLASISVDLLLKLTPQLMTFRGSKEEKSAIDEAKRRLRQAGIYSWSVQNVILNNGAEKLAKPLGLDLQNTTDWMTLENIIAEPDTDERRQQIESLLNTRKKKPSETELNNILSSFDSASGQTMDGLARSYEMSLGDDDSLRLIWQPQNNAMQIIVSGMTDEGSQYQVIFTGNVTPRPTEDGNHLRLVVSKNDPGVQVFAGESLEKLRASIFGSWITADGDIWDIARADGSRQPENNNEPQRTNAQRAEKVREQINKLKKEKVFIWKSSSGKIIRQKKFKRLKDPYEYLGEELADPNAKDKIKALEQQASQAESAAKKLPVDSYDPLEIDDVKFDDAQSVQITVTRKDGYSFSYLRAYFDGYRITAERTLNNVLDIEDLPEQVVAQLIASWSPPEWIELNAKYDPVSSTMSLSGTWWRLNVTYSAGGMFSSGKDFKVKKIHTPWSKKLALTQADVNTADGAAVGALF